MGTALEMTSDSHRHTSESLRTLAAYPQIWLESGKCTGPNAKYHRPLRNIRDADLIAPRKPAGARYG